MSLSKVSFVMFPWVQLVLIIHYTKIVDEQLVKQILP